MAQRFLCPLGLTYTTTDPDAVACLHDAFVALLTYNVSPSPPPAESSGARSPLRVGQRLQSESEFQIDAITVTISVSIFRLFFF